MAAVSTAASGKRTISKESAVHYTWGEGCDGWHLVNTPTLSVIRERMPAGTSERLHFHSRAQQFFFILSGEATFQIDGERVVCGTGEGVRIPPQTKHLIENGGSGDLEFLVVSEPHSHGDRVNVDQGSV